jgi:transposase
MIHAIDIVGNNMPYKTDKMKLDSPFLDRRVKLLPCQREMVLYWTKQGLSQRNLAKMFKVSRRLITFIQDPKKKEKDLANRAARGGTMIYYKGGEEWAATMKDHRRYKHKVLTKTK